MSYVEGFLLAVPTANKDRFRQHAEAGWPWFARAGATRLVENWGVDVPRGTLNDLWGAVEATEDETVLFSWIEYPDRAARDRAHVAMDDRETAAAMKDDPAMQAAGEMPFDAQRMLWGGFEIVSDVRGEVTRATGYVDGFVAPLPDDAHDAYRRHSATAAPAFLDAGALRVVDAIGDDLREGKRTDFFRAVRKRDGETALFGWVEWPDRATRDAGWTQIMADPRFAAAGEPPFDGKRMIHGGFEPVVDRKGDRK